MGFKKKSHNRRLSKLESMSNLSSISNGAKSRMVAGASLDIKNIKLDKLKEKLNHDVKDIATKVQANPYELLKFVKDSKTPVYELKNADVILAKIGENEGFITPLKGFRALYLNLILKRGFSFSTPEMFVLRGDMEINAYVMLHQFYRWYGYKLTMPGYDDDTQDKYKRIFDYENDENLNKLSYNEIINLQEAIKREVEAIDFVVELAREFEGTKRAYEKLKSQDSTNI